MEEDVRAAVLAALEFGYRHLDTASLYRSKRAIGEAVAEVAQRGIVASKEAVYGVQWRNAIGLALLE
jgi:diketogulonate reductase-like aldo/keto reductase